MKETRELSPLNTTRFFCPGCGITQAGEYCPVCANRAPDPMTDRPYVTLAVALLTGIAVIAVGLYIAFQRT